MTMHASDAVERERADAATGPQAGRATGRTMRFALGPMRLSLSASTAIVVAVAVLLLLVTGCAVLMIGTVRLSVGDVVGALVGGGPGKAERVVWGIRLPRLLTAICVGAALGASGCVFQSVSRNALGSPDVIGFTTGAATGATAQIVLIGKGGLATSLAAVGAGLATAIAVYLLARQRGRTGGYRLVLIGIGVSGMLSAMTSILLARSDLDLASRAQVWLAGSLAARTWEHAGIGAIGVVVLVPVLAVFARRLSVMEMGDDQAEGLGVATERTRLVVMLVGVVLAASAVAAAGPIAFVALAAPQITRRLTGVAGVQVLASALVGSLLLVVADLVSVNLPSRLAVPVGLVTGVIGGLYLLWVLSAKEDV